MRDIVFCLVSKTGPAKFKTFCFSWGRKYKMYTLFEEQTLHCPIDYQSQTWAYSSPAHRAADSKTASLNKHTCCATYDGQLSK